MPEKERDLQNEEDTSSDVGQSEDNDNEEDDESTVASDSGSDSGTSEDGEEEEETAESLKSKIKKLEEERDNYKTGLLAAKSKKRHLDTNDSDYKSEKVDVSEEKIRAVLYKDNERKVLREVIDKKSKMFIPELVDDSQFKEIVGYLPRSIDKSSPETIHKALKVAVRSWKLDNDIKDIKEPEEKPGASLAETRSSGSGSQATKKQSTGRKIIKASKGIEDWY